MDPDGRKDEKYEVSLLGRWITITISEKLDSDTRATIKENINAAVAKINAGADNLTSDQVKQINQLKGITVSPNFSSSAMNKMNGVFQMTPAKVVNQRSIDFLAGTILHDTGHMGQSDPTPDTKKFINNEKKASSFAAGVARSIHLDDDVIEWLDKDAETGHLANGQVPPLTPKKP